MCTCKDTFGKICCSQYVYKYINEMCNFIYIYFPVILKSLNNIGLYANISFSININECIF